MAFGHDHDHHHHHHGPDELAAEAPLDAANQSLADALRASFSILKFVMLVLVVMYCFSGVKCIEENEQAVILHFGELQPEVRGSGLSWAFPYPIDETLTFTTKKSNTLPLVLRHWPRVTKERQNLPLDQSQSARGLNPTFDGSLLTSDKGVVHIQWVVTYQVDDLRRYVMYVADGETEDVAKLITVLLENAAVRIVSQYTAEQVTRGKTTEISEAVKLEVNERLAELQTGVRVGPLDIPRSSVPGPTISAFDAVTQAENNKQRAIRDAQQRRSELLNRAAGAAHEDLMALIDAYDLAESKQDTAATDALRLEIDSLLENQAGGEAGQAIRRAKGYYTEVVQGVLGDVEVYNNVLEEYLGSPELFVHRMWEQTRQRVLQSKGVQKHFLTPRMNEIRIKVGEDAEQKKLDEIEALQREAEQYKYANPKSPQAVTP